MSLNACSTRTKFGQSKTGVNIVSTFKSIDVDSNGHISKEELWNHLIKKGAPVEEEDFDRLFRAIDTDNSGGIDINEYSTFGTQVQASFERSKSIMKVKTLGDSISSSSSHSAGGQKGKRRKTLRPSFFSPSKMMRRGSVDLDRENSHQRSKPKIRFFTVESREYDVTVSDNPGVRSGVALELSWRYSTLGQMHIDEFEAKRSLERSKDFKKEKKLTRLEREKTLRHLGYSQQEIEKAARNAAIIRNRRKRSIGTMKHDKVYEKLEKVASLRKKLSCRKADDLNDSVQDFKRLHPSLMAMIEWDVFSHDGGIDIDESSTSGAVQGLLGNDRMTV